MYNEEKDRMKAERKRLLWKKVRISKAKILKYLDVKSTFIIYETRYSFE